MAARELLVHQSEEVVEFFKEVPDHQRRQMAAGMRWTVWLSAISVPFSYGTTILLARTSPEAIGTYGLLSVYIGVVLGLFYLGGDAVAIKFIPTLAPEEQLSFLGSYFLVVCLALLPWLAVAAIWPRTLHYLLGEEASQSFELALLVLSPLSILFSLVGAALKGKLEIGWAQIINRIITIGSFMVYAILYFASRSVLAHSYPLVIWGTYLTFCAVGAAVGIARLLHLSERRAWHSTNFFLPQGFWRYTLSLQQLSALWFFTQRLDAILILNFGSLALLGAYVALITLAESIRLIGKFFLDTLLPSLATMVAAHNLAGAAGAFRTHMRILFLANMGTTCGLILLARPITALLGPKYTGLVPLVIILALFVGLSTPSSVGNTVLQSIGKQQRALGVALGQIALYVMLFALLWRRWQLEGAVVAYGVTWTISNSFYLVVAKLSSPFPISIVREYAAFGVLATAAAILASMHAFGFVGGLFAWGAAVAAFILLAKYRIRECKELIQLFIPPSATRQFLGARPKASH